MAATFDPSTLIITLESGQTVVDASDVYSAWKNWVKSGVGAGIVPAFRVVGGDPITLTQNAGSYFFFRNDLGWRIRPPEEDIQIILNGNFVLEDPTGVWRVPTIGNFNTGIDRNFSSLTTETISGSGVTAQDKQDIKNLIWDSEVNDHQQAGSFGAKIKKLLERNFWIGNK